MRRRPAHAARAATPQRPFTTPVADACIGGTDITNENLVDGREQQVGHSLIGDAIEGAEGMYDYDDWDLTCHHRDNENVHRKATVFRPAARVAPDDGPSRMPHAMVARVLLTSRGPVSRIPTRNHDSHPKAIDATPQL